MFSTKPKTSASIESIFWVLQNDEQIHISYIYIHVDLDKRATFIKSIPAEQIMDGQMNPGFEVLSRAYGKCPMVWRFVNHIT
jgi:hypothetical protein